LLDRHGEHLYTEIRVFTASPKQLQTKGLFVPYDKLKEILNHALEKYRRVPHIVVHKSAPLVDEEVKAVEEVAESQSGGAEEEYPTFYTLVHVKSSTIYRAYDPSASDYSVQRGLMLLRSSKSDRWDNYVLFTTGRLYKAARERGKLGTPRPLELAVKTNMPQAPRDIGEQILALTKLDWNTTDPEVRMPITITYSRKAAQMAPEILGTKLPNLKIADIRDFM